MTHDGVFQDGRGDDLRPVLVQRLNLLNRDLSILQRIAGHRLHRVLETTDRRSSLHRLSYRQTFRGRHDDVGQLVRRCFVLRFIAVRLRLSQTRWLHQSVGNYLRFYDSVLGRRWRLGRERRRRRVRLDDDWRERSNWSQLLDWRSGLALGRQRVSRPHVLGLKFLRIRRPHQPSSDPSTLQNVVVERSSLETAHLNARAYSTRYDITVVRHKARSSLKINRIRSDDEVVACIMQPHRTMLAGVLR